MGLVLSPWAILALPAAALIGFAFAACGMAATTFMRTWQDFEWVQLATLPHVPVLGDLLPTVDLRPGPPDRGEGHAPLPRRGPRPSPHHRATWGGACSGTCSTWPSMGLIGLTVASRRLGQLLLK